MILFDDSQILTTTDLRQMLAEADHKVAEMKQGERIRVEALANCLLSSDCDCPACRQVFAAQKGATR